MLLTSFDGGYIHQESWSWVDVTVGNPIITGNNKVPMWIWAYR